MTFLKGGTYDAVHEALKQLFARHRVDAAYTDPVEEERFLNSEDSRHVLAHDVIDEIRKVLDARPKRVTVKSLAKEIEKRWPELIVRVDRGFCDTDRKITGTRLRHPGKGRWGTRIRVYRPWTRTEKAKSRRAGWIVPMTPGALLFEHNNAETYRRTDEVRQWIDDRAAAQRKKKGRR